MSYDYPLKITQLPFSCRDTRCMIFYENNGAPLDADNGMYLSQNTPGILGGGAQFYRNKDYLLITPMYKEEILNYTYTSTMSSVNMSTDKGNIYISFDKNGNMRIFTKGINLRLTAKMGFGDVAELKGNAAYGSIDGAIYYLYPVKGSVTVDSHYNLLTYRNTDPIIDFTPDKDGIIEIAVFDHVENEETIEPAVFEECKENTKNSFDAFTKTIIDTEITEQTAMEIYGLWIGKTKFPGQPDGVFPSNVIDTVYPKAIEQPILSLAFSDIQEAYSLINTFTKYITPNGLVPEKTTGMKQLYQTASMDYGYAVLELLNKGKIEQEMLSKLYDLLATVDNWWVKYRSDDGGQSFFYAYRYESGYTNASLFDEGTPTVTADLMARMILSAKALAAIAAELKITDAVEKWNNVMNTRLSFLTEVMWNGKGYDSLRNGTKYEHECALNYMPLLLGKTLPQTNVNVLAEQLTNGKLNAERGIKLNTDDSTVNVVVSSLLAAGLADCGLYEYSKEIVEKLSKTEKEYGLLNTWPTVDVPEYRCASMYSPTVCAAKLFCTNKINQRG